MNPRYPYCCAPGCARQTRPFSRFCRHHFKTLEQTRDINGTIVRKQELKALREVAGAWITEHRDHPATVTALEFMAELLTPSDRARFLQSEWDRLRARGATPEGLLGSVIAFQMYLERMRSPMPTRTEWVNRGRAVLGTVPGKRRTSHTGKTYAVNLKPGHAEALGKYVAENVGGFAVIAARRILNTGANDTAGAIRIALESEPL